VVRPSCGSSAESAQDGGDGKRDESHLSTHGGFLLLPDATRIESMAVSPNGKAEGSIQIAYDKLDRCERSEGGATAAALSQSRSSARMDKIPEILS
jgi:hypothetical protein